ncbi:YggT family protein [Kiloniella laminariae]|uniref:YggT family protein n=1 Tax=Kiloniella laminariae TaxID=454162 RepID=A0ABT4LIS2_9PROT|nr:YggT family protein [Kiloniella laminariae]MCZ4280998.1 YggT family protein [Kiloniella laminariae]
MDIILGPLITVTLVALDLFKWALIISIILSWLVNFNVVNTQNPFVNTVGEFLWRLTEPALRPIRKVVPTISGIDLSPIVLFLIIMFIQNMLARLAYSIG